MLAVFTICFLVLVRAVIGGIEEGADESFGEKNYEANSYVLHVIFSFLIIQITIQQPVHLTKVSTEVI